jgi:hypothetical protein
MLPCAAQAAAQASPVKVPTTTAGYNYDVPAVTLPVRPAPTTAAPRPSPTTPAPRPVPTTTEPLALYGPPARQGRTFSEGRRNNR